ATAHDAAAPVELVLVRDRNAVQRPAPAPRRRIGVGGARARQRALGVERDEERERTLQPLGALHARARDLERGELLRANLRRHLGERQAADLVAHRFASVAASSASRKKPGSSSKRSVATSSESSAP